MSSIIMLTVEMLKCTKSMSALELMKYGKYSFLFGTIITFKKHIKIGPKVIFYSYLINA